MSRPPTIDDLYRFALPGDPSLSPDGERTVYTLTTQNAELDRPETALWEVRTGGGAPRPLTRGPADTAPRWSPDGSAVAFLRDGQIHLLPADGGEPLPLTFRRPGAGTPVWSPDGARVAFAAPVAAPDPAAPVELDRLGHRAKGRGLAGHVRDHLFVVEVAGGTIRQVTEGPFDAGGPAWSPDGSRLAFPASIGPGADLTGARGAYIADALRAAPVRLGAGLTGPVGPAGGLTGPVSWFPDGDALLAVARQAVTLGHLGLWRLPLDGTAPTELTAGLDRNVMPGERAGYPGALPQFAGDELLFAARDRGSTRLFRAGPSGIAPVLPDAVSGCSVAAKAGRAALVVSDTASFAEIAVLELSTGAAVRLTRHTAESLPGVGFHPVTEREFTISDGTRVHGLVIRDPGAPRGGPLLVDLHGGPHNAWSAQADPVHLYHQELATLGWTILALNIRGSDGYGERFYTAAVNAWGEADERDVLEPLDALVAEGLADHDRIALTGYSYGGYLSCWLSARNGRFRAVVPGGAVTDLASMAATSDEGRSLTTMEITDPERLTALSPIAHADGVRPPTLLLHGGADETCPPGQAELWFHALRTRGVPARLVLYPGADHLFILNGRPSHRADYCRRVVDFVTRHLRGDHA